LRLQRVQHHSLPLPSCSFCNTCKAEGASLLTRWKFHIGGQVLAHIVHGWKECVGMLTTPFSITNGLMVGSFKWIGAQVE
jgi:hypothetical protein